MMSRGTNQRKWKVYFYETRSKRTPVKDFLSSRTPRERADFAKHVKLLREFGIELGMPHAKAVTGYKPLWELRPEGFRILYFIDAYRQFILLHGFLKKEDKIPPRHIETAEDRLHDYRERFE